MLARWIGFVPQGAPACILRNPAMMPMKPPVPYFTSSTNLLRGVNHARMQRILLPQGAAVLCPGLDVRQWTLWLEQLPGRISAGVEAAVGGSIFQTNGRGFFRVAAPDGSLAAVKCYPARQAVPQFDPGASRSAARPQRAFLCNVALWREGLAVPEPLGFLTIRGGTERYCCYAVTRWLQDAEPLTSFAFENCRRNARPRAWLRTWGRGVMDSILALHRAGYAHGDLHHNNILVRTAAEDFCGRFAITDFDLCGVGRRRPPRTAQLVDLARLGASMCQTVPGWLLVELLAYYLRRCGLSRAQRKACRIAVATAYQRIVDEYVACFTRVEACCLAQAEQALASANAPT
jgi:hypothetical protein